MKDAPTTLAELLLSEPEILAWLGLDERRSDEHADDPAVEPPVLLAASA